MMSFFFKTIFLEQSCDLKVTFPLQFLLNTVQFSHSVMYGCESWIMKKAKHQRIDAFELWCWRRLLRVLDNREIKSVSPKENQP